MRRSLPFHPEFFVEADRVHNERVSFPVTNRVPVVTGNQVLGMRPPIQINDSKGLRAGDVEDINGLKVG